MALLTAAGASLVWPAGNGLFIDLIDGYKEEEEEIAGLRGFTHNFAFILGPILAGLLAKFFGLDLVFLIFGAFLVFGAVFMKLLW